MSHSIVVTRVQEAVLEFTDEEWDDMQAEGDVPEIIYEIAYDSYTTVKQTIEEV